MPITVPGSVAGDGLRGARPGRAGCLSRQAEVENLDLAVLEQEDVLGLQVAMDEALVVRGGEPARDLHGDVDRLAHRERAVLGQPLAQRLAVEQLRDDEDARPSCTPMS